MGSKIKLISWNVNGIRAVAGKGFFEILKNLDPDVLCVQETKAQQDNMPGIPDGLKQYDLIVNSAVQKGYAGTAVFSKIKPVGYKTGIGLEEYDQEGRVITMDYGSFYLVNVYVPNSGQDLKRLGYRKEWDKELGKYLRNLDTQKPVVFSGDLNVAHEPIDLARPKENYNKTSGYTQVEIDGFRNFLDMGMLDTFRLLNGNKVQYSYWSQRFNARAKNLGWRIDYFLVSNRISDKVTEAFILPEIAGSDHCPVGIVLGI
jgi:exodeoxyribonuclease-3